MIIGITGYGYSGASAYIDVLKEFENMQFLPRNNEFPILQQTDGILDLRHALVHERRRLNINNAIVRFIHNTKDKRYNKLERLSNGKYSVLSKEYIDSLIEITWKGRSAFDPGDIRNGLERPFLNLPNRVIRKMLRLFDAHAIWPLPKERYYTDISEEAFLVQTQVYMNKLLQALGFDTNKDIILEQVFNTIDPLLGSEFFTDDVLSIIVDRDPRDIFLLTNILHPEKCSFLPCDGSVEKFVYYYNGLHASSAQSKNILRLHFEDLIYRYDHIIQMLENALNKKIVNKRQYFQPERSINNIHMFKKYPDYSKEFAYIEKHCAAFLYDFQSGEKENRIQAANVKPF